MRLIVVGLIVVAVFIAGMAVFLAQNFLAQQEDEIRKQMEAKDQVLVANVELGIGSTVVRDNVRWQPWPAEGLAPDYVVNVEGRDNISKYLGSVVRQPIAAGEPITASRLVKRDAPGFLSAILAPGKRAVVVQVSNLTGTGGFILPGDYVDVLLTHGSYASKYNAAVASDSIRSGGADLPPALSLSTETVLTNVRVLAVDTIVGKVETTSRAAKTVTLEVTPKEMQVVYTAARVGTISLALRSLRPGADIDENELMINTTDIETSPLLQRLLRYEQQQEQQRLASVGLDDVLFGRQLQGATTPPVNGQQEALPPSTTPDLGLPETPPQNILVPEVMDPDMEDPDMVEPQNQAKRPSLKIYRGGVENVEEWVPK
ncbi:MAG: Flp pilus assembly protein CpaB [Magnetospiraceae bacterium]